MLLSEQVAKICKEQGAGNVQLLYADLTNPQEAQRLGEVSIEPFRVFGESISRAWMPKWYNTTDVQLN